MNEERVAIITGVSSGIGRNTAELLAKNGFRVYGTVRELKGAAAPPPGVKLVTLEVRDDSSVKCCVEQLLDEAGRIDLLVNNAGMALHGAVEETTTEEAKGIFETNFFGVHRVTRAVLPAMRKQHYGRMVNIVSVAGFVPMPFQAFYSASKHALEGYTETLDHEVRRFGIRAIVVEPGYIRTEIGRKSLAVKTHLQVYQEEYKCATSRVAHEVDTGDSAGSVARVVLKAATDAFPELHYSAGRGAATVRLLHWSLPTTFFDQALRRHFGLR